MGNCASCGEPPQKPRNDAKKNATATPVNAAATDRHVKGGDGPLPDKALDSSFHAVKQLGSGTAGDIFLCKQPSQNNRMVAVKLFPRPFKNGNQTTLLREVQVPMDLSQGCVSIVTAYEALLTPTHLALVMEVAEGGSLTSHVANRYTTANKGQPIMGEDEARYLFQQLIIAVAHCHKHGWAHRDVKLDNVLMTLSNPPEIKLCDFGFAKPLDSPMTSGPAQTHLGTPEYMSPELLTHDKQGDRSPYNATTVDVWASGVMLVVSLLGAFPFDNQKKHHKSVREAELDLWMQEVNQHWYDSEHIRSNVSKLSPECRDLLDKIFVTNPQERITITQIQAHPWYNQPLTPQYQQAAGKVAQQQAQLDQQINAVPSNPSKVQERRRMIDQMVAAACHGKGKDSEAVTHVDLTHQGVS
ncbi:hypothetical protein WJX74_004269 [Apatococcus lobatus]|uniref:Protein kinase domain-containing protein n=1 Tax=Apatococcus lobatus TaxID=904363 RepID=A0AAW1QHF6_9CHLO